MAKKTDKSTIGDGLFDDDTPLGSEVLTRTHTWDFALINEESVYEKLSHPGKHPVRRFTLTGKLGQGSMGHVFSLRDVNCDREVACKILRADDEASTARFVEQARTVAGLEHPGIIPIYEVKVDEDRKPYVVMRKLKGTTLKTKIDEAAKRRFRGGSLPVDEIVLTFLKICDALSYAHSKGCFHQDIKPGNVMLGEFGEVFLIDWGAGTDETIGTPAYMSPQQASGELPTATDDIYCLGSTLFHCLALRFPVYGKSCEELIEKKKTSTIDPLRQREKRTIPPELLSVALKAMDPDPQKRYQSVAEFAEDLKNYQSGFSVTAHTDSVWLHVKRWTKQHRHRVHAIIGIAAVVLISALVFYRLHLKELSYWGNPLHVAEFNEPDWQSHWLEHKGKFLVKGRRLETAADDSGNHTCILIYRKRLTGSHAIEVDLRTVPGRPPGEMGVAWFREPPWTNPAPSPIIVSLSSANAMIRQGRRCLARSDRHFVAGQTYRARVEADGDQIRLYIGEELVCTHTEPFPIVAGYVALYGRFSGRQFDNVRIYTKNAAEKIPVTEIGDALLAEKLYDDAQVLYKRVVKSHANRPIGRRAAYQVGVCQFRTGHQDEALKTWKSLKGTSVDLQARRHLMRRLFEEGEHDAVFARLRKMLEGEDAERHRAAAATWAAFAALLHKRCQGEALKKYVLFHNSNFPHERTHEYLLANIWLDAGDYSRVLERTPDERWACAEALFRLGRHSEVLERYADIPDATSKSMTVLGKIDQALALYPEHHWEIAQTAYDWGKLDDIIRLYPNADVHVQASIRQLGRLREFTKSMEPATRTLGRAMLDLGRFDVVQQGYGQDPDLTGDMLLRLGQYQEALARDDLMPRHRAAALLALNRCSEIKPPVDASVTTEAMLRAGRYQEVILTGSACPENWVRAGYLAGRADALAMRTTYNARLTRMLYLYQGRLDALLSLPGSSPRKTAEYLLERGEHEKLKSGFAQFGEFQAIIAHREGRYEDILKLHPENRSECAYALAMLKRTDDLTKSYPDQRRRLAQQLLRKGRYKRVLERYPDVRRECALADLYVRSPWYVVREYREQLEAHSLAFSAVALDFAIENKRRNAVRTWSRLNSSRIPMRDDLLMFPCFIIPQFYTSLQQQGLFTEYCLKLAQKHRYPFAQQLWYIASFLSGGVTEEEFLAQPVREFAPANLLICKAMLAELSHRHADAAGYYRQYSSMPPNQKPTNPVVDRFARWRCQVTAGGKRGNVPEPKR